MILLSEVIWSVTELEADPMFLAPVSRVHPLKINLRLLGSLLTGAADGSSGSTPDYFDADTSFV